MLYQHLEGKPMEMAYLGRQDSQDTYLAHLIVSVKDNTL